MEMGRVKGKQGLGTKENKRNGEDKRHCARASRQDAAARAWDTRHHSRMQRPGHGARDIIAGCSGQGMGRETS